jgi:hypothetical protein
MSACSVLRSIEQTQQQIANFINNPAALTATQRVRLSNLIESIRGAVRELPLRSGPKDDIINRLNQANNLILNGSASIATILAVLQILSLVALKVQTRKLPCPQGLVTVIPSNCFNTICKCCN